MQCHREGHLQPVREARDSGKAHRNRDVKGPCLGQIFVDSIDRLAHALERVHEAIVPLRLDIGELLG